METACFYRVYKPSISINFKVLCMITEGSNLLRGNVRNLVYKSNFASDKKYKFPPRDYLTAISYPSKYN